MTRFGALALATLVAAGCAPATVISYKSPPDGAGLAYYLPKRLIRLQLDRAPASASDQVEKAKSNLAAAEESEKKAAGAAKSAAKVRDELAKGAGGTSSAAYAEQVKAVQVAEANAALAKQAVANAQKALKEAVSVDWFAAPDGKGILLDTFTIALSAPVADTDERFVAVGHHVPSRTDTFSLKTNTSGLLSNADAIAEDQTAAIIVSLAGAGAGLRATTTPLTLTEAFRPEARKNCLAEGPVPFSVEFLLDPRELRDGTSKIESQLCALGAAYRFALTPLSKGPLAGGRVPSNEGDGGIYYRRELPHLLSIHRLNESNEPKLVKAILLAMPNFSPREFLALEGGAFTKREYTNIFDNGILISHTASKPSELLAVAKIPVDVMKAIFSIPTELITLKVNYTNAGKDLAEAQKAILEAAKALEDARKTP
jgi:hypothetical protein